MITVMDYERIMTWRSQNLWKMFQRIAFDLSHLGELGQDLRLFLRKDDVSLLVFVYCRGRKTWDHAPFAGTMVISEKAYTVRFLRRLNVRMSAACLLAMRRDDR